jgi:predicted AAA+ superfamily ATPase
MKEILTELILEFYDRKIPELKPRLVALPEYARNASIVTGMRRTGKTFRIYQRINELMAQGINKKRLLYLNFDDERLFGFKTEDFRLIPDIFYQAFPENRDLLCYFFLDEIQDAPNWELFVRRLIDAGNVQVYLTGSSSKLLTTEIATSMRGRSVETEVFPLSFAEFLLFHNLFEEIPQLFSPAIKSKLCHALSQYFQTGGFPDVQSLSSVSWVSVLQDYVNNVLFRDVQERYKITNTLALRHIMQKAFHTPGEKLSANKLHKELKGLGIKSDRESLTLFIDYFCRAYLFYAVPYHTDSLAKVRVNPPKIYLVDVGMIRAMNSKQSADKGLLLENLVFLHLRRQGYTIEYLITKKGFEVDFIASHKFEREYRIIQSCYKISDPATFQREIRAILDVREYTKAKECVIVTWDEEQELDNGIKIVPAWKFLLDRY